MTIVHRQPDGVLVEYRRHPGTWGLEHRLLRPDGTPYSSRWFPVNSRHLLELPRELADKLCT